MSERADWNRKVIEEFRTNAGKVGGDFEGIPLLLLHHTGAKSGVEYVNPLAYRRVGDGYAVFASKGGAPTNPDWFHNLVANPDVRVEVGTGAGTESFSARARVAAEDERERIWTAQKEAFPNFAKYEESAGARKIPVVVLERT